MLLSASVNNVFILTNPVTSDLGSQWWRLPPVFVTVLVSQWWRPPPVSVKDLVPLSPGME